MNLYYVTNGYVGNSEVHSYVIAESIEDARLVATIEFKKSAKISNHEIDYYNNLKIELLDKNIVFPYSTGAGE